MVNVLIAGIDPGTHSAFAVITLSGDVIKITSARNASIQQIIRELVSCGKIAIIGTDVTPIPPAVKKIASVLGARIIAPDHNLHFKEKRKIVDKFLKKKSESIFIQNKHEKAALSAAVYSLKRVNPLFKKIEDTLRQKQLEHLSPRVKERVLLEECSIARALN